MATFLNTQLSVFATSVYLFLLFSSSFLLVFAQQRLIKTKYKVRVHNCGAIELISGTKREKGKIIIFADEKETYKNENIIPMTCELDNTDLQEGEYIFTVVGTYIPAIDVKQKVTKIMFSL